MSGTTTKNCGSSSATSPSWEVVGETTTTTTTSDAPSSPTLTTVNDDEGVSDDEEVHRLLDAEIAAIRARIAILEHEIRQLREEDRRLVAAERAAERRWALQGRRYW